MYLGLDLGTSSFKVVIIGEDQHVIASEAVPLDVTRPQPGWSEQNPDDW
ncbi:MAG: FGGY family carbohydrate kinase, partial [Alphaproteobacteria bacterium]